VATETLTEAEKMQRVPGIIYADGPTGRRARIAGTGLDVFEVIGPYRYMTGGWPELRAAYHWLTEAQLRAALTFYETFPDEIDARLAREDAWTEERLYATYPFMKPR
jgi:uncharacterized protein (DUF433 family)